MATTGDSDTHAAGAPDPGAISTGPGGTPEGHTPEAAAPDEYGKPGTPAAGLSPEVKHPADADDLPRSEEDAHAADAHHVGGGHEHQHMVGGHAHEDDHSADHADVPLGPIDWGAWLVSVVGAGAGLIVALALFLSIQNG